MKVIFDETNEAEGKFHRTLWFGYFDKNFDNNLEVEIAEEVIKTLKTATSTVESTSWVFYSKEPSKDAIEEEIRTNIMVKNYKGKFTIHINMSDFEFVVFYDMINSFKLNLQSKLDASL